MSACRHERARWSEWTGEEWRDVGMLSGHPLGGVACNFGRLICDCGHWLSLGPANDGGEHAAQVAVEIAAAHRASERDVGTLIAVDNAGCITTDETGCRECQTWYLARAITTHQDPTE